MKNNKLRTILIIGTLTVFSAVFVNGQNTLNGKYIYKVKNNEDSSSFFLTFERENAVYYSYFYEGAGTLGGTWTRENEIIKVVLTRGDANWTFKLKQKGADLEITEKLSKTGTDETPDFTTILPAGTVFEKDDSKPSGPDLTAADFSKRALKLIASVHSLKDISPENIERRTGIKVSFNEENRREYGFGGNVVAAPDWTYGLIAYPYPSKDNKQTDTLHFSFDYRLHEPAYPDLSPICSIDFDAFGKELQKAGFSTPTPVRGNHNVIIYWQSARDKTSLNISADGADKDSRRQCVKMVTVSILN